VISSHSAVYPNPSTPAAWPIACLEGARVLLMT